MDLRAYTRVDQTRWVEDDRGQSSRNSDCRVRGHSFRPSIILSLSHELTQKSGGLLYSHGKPSLGLSHALLGKESEEFIISLMEKRGHKCTSPEVRHSPWRGL